MERSSALAAKLLQVRRTAKRIAVPTEVEAPRELAEAYAVQAAVTAGLGEMAGAYKVGIAAGGVTIFAPIHRSQIVVSARSYAAAPFDRVGIELEFAFRFARQVPATATPEQVRAAIDRVYVAIELCETRYTTNEGVEKFTALADHQFNRGLVLGADAPFDPARDYKGAASRWIIDGKPTLEKKASHPNGDPLSPLYALPAAMAAQRRGLEPGQMVITGSLNGLTWVRPGTRVEGRIDGFGEVEVDIVA